MEDLDRIDAHTQRLQDPPGQGVLELAVTPTFANTWIIPRLPAFLAKNPGITINLTGRVEPSLFAESPVDAAIHWDGPGWVGMMKKHLFAESLIPVCSPALAGGRALLSLEAMGKLPRLHRRGQNGAWKRWWEEVGVADIRATEGAQHDRYSTTIEAACAGLGVALVPRLYAAKEIEAGRLMVPHAHELQAENRYCVVLPVLKYGSWPLTPFLDWLMQEARAYERQRDASPAGAVSPDGGLAVGHLNGMNRALNARPGSRSAGEPERRRVQQAREPAHYIGRL